MTDSAREARRRQLMAAVSVLSVSLGMSSEAVADQIKGEVVAQKVTPGVQSSQKVGQGVQSSLKTQSSIKGEGQSSIKLDSAATQVSKKY